jgi:hypothetical protein
MAEFRVELEGLELSKEQSQRLSSGVQRLVLQELAGLDFKGDDAFAVIRDPEWLGIWLRQLRRPDFERLDPGILEKFGTKG